MLTGFCSLLVINSVKEVCPGGESVVKFKVRGRVRHACVYSLKPDSKEVQSSVWWFSFKGNVTSKHAMPWQPLEKKTNVHV